MSGDLRADLRAFAAAGRKEFRLLRRYPTLFLGFLFWPIDTPKIRTSTAPTKVNM